MRSQVRRQTKPNPLIAAEEETRAVYRELDLRPLERACILTVRSAVTF
jgi:hypothetical protein